MSIDIFLLKKLEREKPVLELPTIQKRKEESKHVSFVHANP